MRVVCVDDDPMILRLLTTALERHLGARVEGFEDSELALDALLRAEPPELVILDAMMPKLDGFELCRRLREAWQARSPTILFLTAGGPEHRERAIEAGAAAALAKPFQPNELAREIGRLCGKESL